MGLESGTSGPTPAATARSGVEAKRRAEREAKAQKESERLALVRGLVTRFKAATSTPVLRWLSRAGGESISAHAIHQAGPASNVERENARLFGNRLEFRVHLVTLIQFTFNSQF